MVVISGCAKLAYINHELAVPDANFIGVTASDIENYDLPTDKLCDSDVKRLKQLLDDPRYDDETWQFEIKKMLKIGKKAGKTFGGDPVVRGLRRFLAHLLLRAYLDERIKELSFVSERRVRGRRNIASFSPKPV